ncbi:hypothetical protein EVAR_40569_1 [Eumeta japonica]|uniref:Uncharacterized protein n=1 Tax=Eumeta variegata TaxID=151549 RepID=A0A4C1VY00_EUMVA|nr:hypothetical protein EVAR_40569_1 [Eumeta japonica]
MIASSSEVSGGCGMIEMCTTAWRTQGVFEIRRLLQDKADFTAVIGGNPLSRVRTPYAAAPSNKPSKRIQSFSQLRNNRPRWLLSYSRITLESDF